MRKYLAKKLALSAFLLPFMANLAFANYITSVSLNGKKHLVEINDSKQEIIVDAEDPDSAEDAASAALVNRKSEELDMAVHGMEYEILQSVKEPLEKSVTLANKVNLVSRLFKLKNAKVPPWIFAMHQLNYFNAKVLVAEKAWGMRSQAKTLLEITESRKESDNMEKTDYYSLCKLTDDIVQVTGYIKALNDASNFNIALNNDEITYAKKFVQTWNMKEAEGVVKGLEETFNPERVAKMKEDLEAKLAESREYKDYANKLAKRNLDKIMEDYKITFQKSQPLFLEEHIVPLETSALAQTEAGKQRTKLTVRLEKTGEKSYNLRLYVLADEGFVYQTFTNITLLRPQDMEVGTIGQSAFILKTEKGSLVEKLETLVPYGKDKSIVTAFDAMKEVYNDTISLLLKGWIIRTKNVLNYAGDKFYNEYIGFDEQAVKEEASKLGKGYKIVPILIHPNKAFEQIKGYLFSIPVDKLGGYSELFLNVGIRSGSSDSGEEAFGRITEIKVPIYKKEKAEGILSINDLFKSYQQAFNSKDIEKMVSLKIESSRNFLAFHPEFKKVMVLDNSKLEFAEIKPLYVNENEAKVHVKQVLWSLQPWMDYNPNVKGWGGYEEGRVYRIEHLRNYIVKKEESGWKLDGGFMTTEFISSTVIDEKTKQILAEEKF